ncbi:MAG: His/Gly/Thr/Pro-type tRNA ligase C-terminal domain-containing protein, partial [Eubacteriales bacterium]|nr:His/Gly/Thr/Pro-type tRNA ligase C-terminal domain-containing protein [Eubacteriales bacterium]
SFPFWLSPDQAAIVPIRSDQNEYALKVRDALRDAGIRTDIDLKDKNMKEKIKEFKQYKDPYILVVGKKEAEEGTVSVNIRGTNKNVQNVPLDTLIAFFQKLNREHTLVLPEDIG